MQYQWDSNKSALENFHDELAWNKRLRAGFPTKNESQATGLGLGGILIIILVMFCWYKWYHSKHLPEVGMDAKTFFAEIKDAKKPAFQEIGRTNFGTATVWRNVDGWVIVVDEPTGRITNVENLNSAYNKLAAQELAGANQPIVQFPPAQIKSQNIPVVTLILFPPSVNTSNGFVSVNGMDTRRPSLPFTWDWGDRTTETGWFPKTHIYHNRAHNYMITVVSRYGGTDSARKQILVNFVRAAPGAAQSP
jgi:hypothetical protein